MPCPCSFRPATACGGSPGGPWCAGPPSRSLSLTEQQVLSVLRPRRKPLPAADLAETLGLTLSALPLERLENLGLLRREEVVERRVGDKTLQMVRLTEAEPEKLTPKQQQVYELLEQVGCGSIREVCYFAGVTRGVVETLVRQGVAETYEQEVLRTPLKEETIPVEPPPTPDRGTGRRSGNAVAGLPGRRPDRAFVRG